MKLPTKLRAFACRCDETMAPRHRLDSETTMKDESKEQRNVFFGVPILGFFRYRRQVDVSESRPIFSTHSPPKETANEQAPCSESLYYSALEPTVRFAEDEPPRRKKSAKELWAILREHVKKESFHIQDWRSKTERFRTRNQEKHFSEMTLPYEFGVLHCFAAWIVYLGISIIAYSFIFEKWTAIEVRRNVCVLHVDDA